MARRAVLSDTFSSVGDMYSADHCPFRPRAHSAVHMTLRTKIACWGFDMNKTWHWCWQPLVQALTYAYQMSYCTVATFGLWNQLKKALFSHKKSSRKFQKLCVLNKRAGCFSLQTVLHFPKDMDLTDTNSQKARAVDFVTFDKRGSFFLLRNRANWRITQLKESQG